MYKKVYKVFLFSKGILYKRFTKNILHVSLFYLFLDTTNLSSTILLTIVVQVYQFHGKSEKLKRKKL